MLNTNSYKLSTMATLKNLHMLTTPTPMFLNSANYEPMGSVQVELTERCCIQYQNVAGQLTNVQFHTLPTSWFPFYLPLSVLSQSPQCLYRYILSGLLNSSLDYQLCIGLAPRIADYVFNYTPRGSLGFFIKAEVEVARLELVNDDYEEERERERAMVEQVERELALILESFNPVRKMGASRSLIEKLKKERKVVVVDSELVGTSSCMVCLEDLSSDVLIKMPCSHLFHQDCICRWLEEKNSCPICRCELDDYAL